MASEKQFEEKVKRFLKEEGCWFVKYWGGGEFTKAGVPDILTCVNGCFVGIELKAPNGKPSPLQIHNLKKIDESGGFGILLYPKDFETFQKLIDHLMEEDDFMASVNYGDLKGRWSE